MALMELRLSSVTEVSWRRLLSVPSALNCAAAPPVATSKYFPLFSSETVEPLCSPA